MTSYVRDIASVLMDNGSYESPQDLAAAVLNELGDDPKILQAALYEILPQCMTSIITSRRNANLNGRNAPGRNGGGEPNKGKGKSGHSAKGDGIRAWFSRFLVDMIPTESGWKEMGQCTSDDLLFAANDRRDRAGAILVRAEQYERLARAIKDSAASTIGDLDEATVRAALDGAE